MIKETNIKAVVLKIDSPGGRADAIDEIYMGLLRLKDKKPVVSSIDGSGASGGYYVAIASNFIYAAPTAFEKPKIYSAIGENVGENISLPGVKEGANVVLVDYSHSNVFHPFELNILLSELAKRGYSLRYLSKGRSGGKFKRGQGIYGGCPFECFFWGRD